MIRPASSVPACSRGARECVMDDFAERLASLWNVVGDTPLLQIRCRLGGVERCIYAKYEAENFTGSIKDRMALHILEHAYAAGEIRRGDVIVEATSGNTGISFAALGRALGHPVRIYLPNWLSRERSQLLRSLGASIVEISNQDGGFLGCIEAADDFAASHPHAFRPRQFENRANVEAHARTTGPELLAQIESLGLVPSAFVAGVVVSEGILPGVVAMATGAWMDPATPGEPGALCVHGNPNVLTRDEGTSRLGQGPVAPLWVSLAVADLGVKLAIAVLALAPFRAALGLYYQRP